MKTECTETGCSHGVIGRYRQRGEQEPCYTCNGSGYEHFCETCEEAITEEEHDENEGHCEKHSPINEEN